MRKRIRLYGYGIGQIEVNLLKEYNQYWPYQNDAVMVKSKIEKEILGHSVKGLDDVMKAEEYAGRIGHGNLGEMLEAMIIKDLLPMRKICRNCLKYKNGKCASRVSPYGCCDDGVFPIWK